MKKQYVTPDIEVVKFRFQKIMLEIENYAETPTYDPALQPSVPDQSIPEWTEDVP